MERVKTVEFTDVGVFPKWAAEKQKKYVLLARKTFDIPFASISYVNRTHETLRCEIGYRPDYILGFIPRCYSLAAHAILSTEPMVILDTSTVSFELLSCWLRLAGILIQTGLENARKPACPKTSRDQILRRSSTNH
jgi:hypothetical protein